MIAAVVPAAGASTRMGRPKLALPVGGKPMLERVITALLEGGASPVVVATGPHDPSLTPLAKAAGAEVCELTITTPDMRTTVEQGLRWLDDRYHPQPDDAFLLTPADIPLLDATTVRALCAKWTGRGSASILIPTHAGRRGHPALIAWRHVAGIREMPPGVGIDAYLRDCEIEEVAVRNVGTVQDVDTASDFESLRISVRSLA